MEDSRRTGGVAASKTELSISALKDVEFAEQEIEKEARENEAAEKARVASAPGDFDDNSVSDQETSYRKEVVDAERLEWQNREMELLEEILNLQAYLEERQQYESVVREKERAITEQRSEWEGDVNKRKEEPAESSTEMERLTQELARETKRSEEAEQRLSEQEALWFQSYEEHRVELAAVVTEKEKIEAELEERISLSLETDEAYESILEGAESHRGSRGGVREETVAALEDELAESRVELEELKSTFSSKENDLGDLKKDLQGKVCYHRYLSCLFGLFVIIHRSMLIVAGHAGHCCSEIIRVREMIRMKTSSSCTRLFPALLCLYASWLRKCIFT